MVVGIGFIALSIPQDSEVERKPYREVDIPHPAMSISLRPAMY
jgi:hypothetical protein